MKPTLTQIGKFQKMIKEKLEKNLLVGSEEEYQQIEAFENYGDFLAEVGEENYEKITEQIANKIVLYNLAKNNMLNDAWDKDKISDSLKKAYAFKKTITPQDEYQLNKRNAKFFSLISLLDEYIEDLENITHGQPDFIPVSHFGKSAKKTKTPLKELIREIMKKYKIKKHSSDFKKLIDIFY